MLSIPEKETFYMIIGACECVAPGKALEEGMRRRISAETPQRNPVGSNPTRCGKERCQAEKNGLIRFIRHIGQGIINVLGFGHFFKEPVGFIGFDKSAPGGFSDTP
jgi:hypothetical protein